MTRQCVAKLVIIMSVVPRKVNASELLEKYAPSILAVFSEKVKTEFDFRIFDHQDSGVVYIFCCYVEIEFQNIISYVVYG